MIKLSESICCKSDLKKKLVRLETSIEAFSGFTSVPVTLFSPQHEIVWEFSKQEKFCIANEAYENSCSGCRRLLKEAMCESENEIDAHSFICHTGLLNICKPFYSNGNLIGYFIAGPVAMGRDKAKVVADFYERVSRETVDMPRLMTMTQNLKVYSPEDIEHLSRIFSDILEAVFLKNNAESEGRAIYSQAPLPEIDYNGRSNVIYNALMFIRLHFREITSLAEIAAYVHVSKSYLSTLFKKETGESIVDFVNRLRLEAAAWELSNTGKDITEIALSVGYSESSYFSHLFREKYDCSPTDYRKTQEE